MPWQLSGSGARAYPLGPLLDCIYIFILGSKLWVLGSKLFRNGAVVAIPHPGRVCNLFCVFQLYTCRAMETDWNPGKSQPRRLDRPGDRRPGKGR